LIPTFFFADNYRCIAAIYAVYPLPNAAKEKNMICAIIALVFGGLSLILPAVPVVLPVIGLALAFNAILKERKKENKQKAVPIMAAIALAANGFVTTMFVLHAFVK
jgi:1,4-dihydroxy-2-naphthoate octaprenyltransferase